MPLFQIDVSDSAVNVSAMLRDGALVEEGVKEENEEGEQKTPKLKETHRNIKTFTLCYTDKGETLVISHIKYTRKIKR